MKCIKKSQCLIAVDGPQQATGETYIKIVGTDRVILQHHLSAAFDIDIISAPVGVLRVKRGVNNRHNTSFNLCTFRVSCW